MRIPIFAANWKMNKKLGEVSPYVDSLKSKLGSLYEKAGKNYEVVLASMAVQIPALAEKVRGTPFQVGAQNCGTEKSGAFTGEVSPAALKEAGAPWVIIGHSERRHVFGEKDELIQKRTQAALDEGLKVIFCVGEKLESRKAGETIQVVEGQLSVLKHLSVSHLWQNLVIAYEPVWAIGTGENATPEQAEEVHAFIRRWIADAGWKSEAAQVRILYGGSAKPNNSGDLMKQEDVDGLLVGGASLEGTTFADLILNGLQSET